MSRSDLAMSVVISTYNRSWGLRRAVESMLRRSFRDYEPRLLRWDMTPQDIDRLYDRLRCTGADA